MTFLSGEGVSEGVSRTAPGFLFRRHKKSAKTELWPPTLGFIGRNENLSRSMVGSEAKSIDLQIFIDSDRG